MSQQKKSFILYLDQSELFGKLTNEQAGKLIKHAFSFADGGDESHEDLIVDLAFTSIKQAMNRDTEKWQAQKDQRSAAGKKSAEARAAKANEEQRGPTVVESVERTPTNPTVSVNGSVSVNVSESVSDNDSDKEKLKPSSKHLPGRPDVTVEIIDYLNAKTGKSFRHVDSHSKHIRARLAEGHTLADIRAVIDRKTQEWKGTDSAQYLRPATLFNAEKFNQYIGEIGQPMPNGFKKGVETVDQFVSRATAAGERLQARLDQRDETGAAGNG